MTNPHLEGLTPEFRNRVATLLANCHERGQEYRPFFGLRDPLVQAKFWRQSRSRLQIMSEVDYLRRVGSPLSAACIEFVGPQSGRWATNAKPGFSEHQYGTAVDVFAVADSGAALWNTSAYQILAEEAAKLHLESGYYWKTQDAVHVQAVRRKTGITPQEAEEGLRSKWGDWLQRKGVRI